MDLIVNLDQIAVLHMDLITKNLLDFFIKLNIKPCLITIIKNDYNEYNDYPYSRS
jgi:hypothetical protein